MLEKISSQLAIPIAASLIRSIWLGRVQGLEKLPEKPCIIIANHESYLDFLLLGYALDRLADRRFAFWAKSRVVHHCCWSKLESKFHSIEITSKPAISHIVAKTKQRLREGCDVCIFPEGRRTRTGRITPFREGYLIAASELNVPIVPVVLNNTFNAWPSSKRLPAMVRCDLDVHEPININQNIGRTGIAELNQSIQNRYLTWKEETTNRKY